MSPLGFPIRDRDLGSFRIVESGKVTSPDVATAPGWAAPARVAEVLPVGGSSDGGAGSGAPEGAVPPPKDGKGSTSEAWREYAAAVGVEVEPDAKRDAVISAIEAAGKRTE